MDNSTTTSLGEEEAVDQDISVNNDDASASEEQNEEVQQQRQQPNGEADEVSPTGISANSTTIRRDEQLGDDGEVENVNNDNLVDCQGDQEETHQRMEKDPLNIGVPFPVIVATSRRRRRSRRPLLLLAEGDEPAPNAATSAGTSCTSEVDNDVGACCFEQIPNEQLITKQVGDNNALQQDIDESNQAMYPPQAQYERQMSMPGSYAIGGPGSAMFSEDGDDDTMADDDHHHLDPQSSDSHRLALLHCRQNLPPRDEEDTTQQSFTATISENGTSSRSNSFLVEATLVIDDDDIADNNQNREAGVRQGQVIRAETLISAEAKPFQAGSLVFSRRVVFLALATMGVIVIGFSAGLMARAYDDDDGVPTKPAIRPTPYKLNVLERVRRTGILRCGVCQALQDFSNFLEYAAVVTNNGKTSSAFVGKYCSAIAAAVLGDKNAYELIPAANREAKYKLIANNEVDLVIHREPISMHQDIYEELVDRGFAYTTPYLYSGMAFAGVPEYVACADNDLQIYGECSKMKICIHPSSTLANELQLRLPQKHVIAERLIDTVFSFFLQGKCNVIGTEAAGLAVTVLRDLGYTGELAAGTREHTSDMWAMTSLDHDPEWADLLNAVTMALLAAEQAGITQENAEKIGETALFGEENRDIFINAIKAAGHFGQIYDFFVSRDGRNLVNTGDSGLLVTPSLGELDDVNESPGPVEGGTLETILERGVLHCGVRGNRPGFAAFNNNASTWEGIDIDFCTALAASLFGGEFGSVFFFEVDSSSQSNGYVLLQSGVVDVLSGAVWTLEADIKENVTEVGYSFSQPYFYGPINDTRFDENLALATRHDDSQWSSYVYWTAQSLIYAEENGISQRTSYNMPLVSCFGLDLRRLFRDAVYAVGNYGEVYERHLERILTRGGRNRLNLLDDRGKGPLRYLPPGFML